jgi:hypothetical protein
MIYRKTAKVRMPLRYGNGAMGVWLFLLFTGLPATAQSHGEGADSSGYFDQVILHQKRVDELLDVYERIERVEIRKAGGDPNPSDVKVWRVFPAGTGVDKIPLSPDAKPINPESYREALEKLESSLVWAVQSGAPQREAYAKLERKKKERNDLIDATRKAFIFNKIGEEMRANRLLLIFQMLPNPSFRPSTRNEMLFTKVEGTVWVDKETTELARIEGHVTEDITLALFLAKVYKGSYFMQERYEMEPGVWLPSYQQYDFDGRKFLVPFSIHERTFYTNYKRVGPPKEALQVVRVELGKPPNDRADP